MQINKEELVTIMAIAYLKASSGGELKGKVGAIRKKYMSAALDALIEALPDLLEYHNEIYKDSRVIIEHGATAVELYNQLKDLNKEKKDD